MTPPAGLRLACALVAVGVAAAVGAGPAFAAVEGSAAATPAPLPPTALTTALTTAPAPSADALTPFVDCVQDAPLGAVTSRTVVLGYRSSAATAVTLAAGSGADDLAPGPADRGQPTVFQPGDHHGAWLLTVDAIAEPALTWTLGSATATIDGTAPACTDATALAVSAPAAASTPGTIAVSAAVTRFLLGPPDSGTVAFSFDGGTPTSVAVGPGGIARADLSAPGSGTHTLTATFAPPAESTLRAASASSAVTVTATSSPLAVAVDSVVAGSSAVRVSVTRTVASGTASVAFRTIDGSAHAGRDYVATTGTLSLADGQTTATASVPLPARAPGSPAATFVVVIERSTVGVDTAAATVSLPAVPAPAAPAGTVGSASGGRGDDAGPASALPQSDPTSPGPVAAAPAGQNLLLLLGAVLITAGGIAGVIGLIRAARVRDALS